MDLGVQVDRNSDIEQRTPQPHAMIDKDEGQPGDQIDETTLAHEEDDDAESRLDLI